MNVFFLLYLDKTLQCGRKEEELQQEVEHRKQRRNLLRVFCFFLLQLARGTVSVHLHSLSFFLQA